MWNSFPNHVVLAESTNSFKSRLGNHSKNQDIIYYNFQSEITGTEAAARLVVPYNF